MRCFKPVLAALSALTALSLSSCLMGLDPAWKSKETSVSLNLPSVSADSGDSRALIQGTGFLYIRTLGGPAGTVAPLYGPFQIDKPDFETKQIPAGTYSDILVLYSSIKLDDKKFTSLSLGTKTFREIFSLPDTDLTAWMNDKTNGVSTLDSAIDGYASAAKTGAVTILQGIRNVLPILTLKPITGGSVYQGTDGFLFNVASPAGTMTRKFFLFDGVVSGATYDHLECYLTAASPNARLGRVGLFEADGKQLSMSEPLGAVSADETKTVNAPFTGKTAYYAYIEYEGEFDVRCVGVAAPVTGGVTVSVTGSNSALAGKRAFFGIYDAIEIVDSMGPPETSAGLGIIELDLSGNGSAQAFAPGSATNPPTLLSGHKYVVFLFVDANKNYDGVQIADIPSLGDVSGIVPHHGDYVNDDPGLLDPAASFALDGKNFLPSSTYVYFVSQSGSGLGQVRSAPMSLSSALADIPKHSTETDASFELYLTESVSLSSSVTVEREVSLLSADGAQKTVGFASVSSGPAFTVTAAGANYSATYGALPYASAELILRNVVLDGTGRAAASAPAVSVTNNSVLSLGPGSGIKNSAITGGNGGAAYLDGGILYMSGSTISYCSADNGGAIYASSGSVFLGSGAVIEENKIAAEGSGGGIYLDTYSDLTLQSGSTGTFVRKNVATAGGGVYIEEGGFLYDVDKLAATVITGNTPDNLVYNMPPVTINFYSGDYPFALSGDTYNPGLEPTEAYTFGAPAGFDSYAWALNGFPLAGTGSQVSFVPAVGLDPNIWWEGPNNISVTVTKDGIPNSVTNSFTIGTYVGGY